MKQMLKPLIGLALTWLLSAHAETLEGPDGTYIRSVKSFDGYVYRQDQDGGHFVTGTAPPQTRPNNIFAIGKVPRTQFDLFSLKEEEALWELQQAELARRQAMQAPLVSHAKRGPLNWPKVVLRDNVTCVPKTPFANAPDWRDHLTCWNSETKNVE